MLLIGFVLSSLALTGYPPSPGPETWGFRKDLANASVMQAQPVADEVRVPWLTNRISRCYFSPIKRPPFNRDELADEIDYYPEPYLARLRSERINGLWITVEFEDLLAHPKHLDKLRAVTERCEKYGIKVWIFAMEPKAVRRGNPRLKAAPELFPVTSVWDHDLYLWCASDRRTLDYLHDSVRDIFRAAPKLGGMLSITHGERTCSCFSNVSATRNGETKACSVCAKKEPWQLHYALTEALVTGMREVNPKAEFMSWFYMPYPSDTRADWVAEAANHLPDGVTLLANFESGIVREQLGKPRIGGDYWLSAVGPSKPFAELAAAALEAGMPFGAKIQVGCSHEDATLPFVPVPGLLYRKYKAMKEAGCTAVLQCWYFGNYPGIMNRAAGELAYADFSEDEKTFLRRLARAEWGEDANEVADIWGVLTDAYADYPLSNGVQYFGPFHAGVVWPLEPDLELRPLGRTWVCEKGPPGDAVGECLADHTLDEALELARRMAEKSATVVGRIDRLSRRYAGNRDRALDLGVMRALTVQFASAYDVFDFYAARAEAVAASRTAHDTARAVAALERMRQAARRERAATRTMCDLASRDSRLGFHSEAEAHQFFPARLDWRLETLAETERRLEEIVREVSAGRPYPPSAWERAAPICAMDGSWTEGDGLRFRLVSNNDGAVRLEAESVRGGVFQVCVYDVAGIAFPKQAQLRFENGRAEVSLNLEPDDRLMIMRGEGVPVWPRGTEDVNYRLVIGRADAQKSGRCVRSASPAKDP